jgi:putative Mg2+ transporter-C (MgtC) family protein
MEDPYVTTALRLLAALVAGAVIGFERAYHGRPAGLRTHTLVCTASSLLMLLTVYQWMLLPEAPIETVRVDPTRMAQGIMTGIGFLGAGAIMKDKITVRGLTTAASIWMTASIGIIMGMGFYFAGFLALLLTLVTLSLLRWFETITPSLHYARLTVRFLRDGQASDRTLEEVLRTHKMTSAARSFHLEQQGKRLQFRMTIRTRDQRNFQRLAESLAIMEGVEEFSILPTGD